MSVPMIARKILVVDDSPTEMKVVVSALQRAGHTITTATNGEDAIAKAAAEKPDIIVLDVVMPAKNGFQVCRQLKTADETKAIKVLLLTSKNQESDKFWGIKQGADAYLTKPFDPEVLVSELAKLS